MRKSSRAITPPRAKLKFDNGIPYDPKRIFKEISIGKIAKEREKLKMNLIPA
jgi:hypothetical protein